MIEAWADFVLIVFVEFLLFIILAYYCKKNFFAISRILAWGVLAGIVVGLLSDLLFGKFFGLWSYTLGYDAFPLILNSALIWGLFSASILLMQKIKLFYFLIWTMVIMSVYEIANIFLGVWTYEFTLPFLGFISFLMVGNLIVAIFIAVIWHVFLGQRFLFIDDFLKKF